MNNYASRLVSELRLRALDAEGFGDSAGTYIAVHLGKDRDVTISNAERENRPFPEFPDDDQPVLIADGDQGYQFELPADSPVAMVAAIVAVYCAYAS